MEWLRVDKIKLEGFGCYSQGLDIDLPKAQACVFIGPNEAGKSTLAEAIAAVIFGFKTREIERRYEPWKEGADYAGSIRLRAGETCYEIRRDFLTHDVRVMRDETVLLCDKVNPRGRGSAERRVLEGILEDLFGFSRREIFTKSAFVGQLELETELSEEVRRVLSGAGPRDYVAALDFLYEAHDRLTMENPWGGRKRKGRLIENTEGGLAALTASLQEVSLTEREDLDLQSKLEALETQMSEAKERERDLAASVESCGTMFDLERRLSKAEDEYRLVGDEKRATERRLKEHGELRDSLSGGYPDLDGLSKQERRDVAEAASLIREHRRVIAEAENLAAQMKTRQVSSRRWPIALGAVAALVVGSLAGALGYGTSIAIAAGSAFGIVSVVVWWVAASGARREMTESRRKAAELGETLSRLERSLSQRTEKILRIAGTDGILRRLAAASDMLGKLEVLDDELAAGRSIDEIDDELSQKVFNAASIRERIERLEKDHPYLREEGDDPAVRVERLKADLVNSRERIAQIDRERKEVEIRLRVLAEAGPRRSAPAIQEEIDEAKSKLASLRTRKDAIRIAVEELKAAVEDCSEDCLEDVGRRAGELFSLITGGRYESLILEGEDMTPVLNLMGRRVEPESISHGTKDQLFLSLRVGLLEGLSGRRRLPLVLDDCLVNFDDRRMEKVREILLSVAEQGHQVILLTHDRRIADWGLPVVELEAATSVGSPGN